MQDDFINTDMPADTIHCFKNLILPIPGVYSRGGGASLPKKSLVAINNKLRQGFKLVDPVNQKRKMLMYAHKSGGDYGHRREWLNMATTKKAFQAAFDVRDVFDFGQLTIKEQADAFNEADILVLVHGGEMANAIFCHRGAFVYELSCDGYTHLGQGIDMSKIGVHFQAVGVRSVGSCVKAKGGEDGQGSLDDNLNLNAEQLKKMLLKDRAITEEEAALIK